MSKSKRFRTHDDLHEYLDALEGTYDVRIELQFIPDASLPSNEQYLRLRAFWREPGPGLEPLLCEGRYRVAKWPGEAIMPSLLRAASDFTYSVLTTYFNAI